MMVPGTTLHTASRGAGETVIQYILLHRIVGARYKSLIMFQFCLVACILLDLERYSDVLA
jgi:hypothetical protein